jgi:hypothetical protein
METSHQQTSVEPYNIYEPHQQRVVDSPARFKVIVWHRKARKTTMVIKQLVRQAMLFPGTYWYVAPLRTQAKKIVWDDPEMLQKYVPYEIWKNRNNTDLTVKFPNGSILYVLGADNPDSLRGPNPRGTVLDEYGDMKTDVWSAILQPIVVSNPQAWCWFIGTPKGKNEFWYKLQFAKDNNGWAYSVLPASKSGLLTPEQIQQAKTSTTQAFYEQEYECSFLEGAGQFFRRIHQNLYDRQQGQPEYGDFQLGVDLAKYQDFTVLTPFNLNTMRAYVQDRFNQVDWPLQKARIEAAALRYRARVKIDRTGLGDPVVDDLKARGLNIGDEDAIKFTEVTRMNLLNNLAMLLEQDKIQIPDDPGLIAELESFQYYLSPLGKIKVGCPEGMHDDRVMSLALAVNGVTEAVPIDMHLHNPRFANREMEGNIYMTTYE